ncbi:hypothetical protein OLCHANIL_00125 [Vibrio phage V05]|uniref:Uncharacterized protein n=2 Tax=Schizotequatrovirus KVP40 TaxID=1914019 RepID=A0A6H0XA87_9CAUD|nr:hypothetical protein pp2_200 [Vibrio phage phi-pp2]QIW90222.1 hypothetical protein OLCHANIL_00125 [Vibrio phage V05]QIW91210.1 hypothetical protein COHAPHLL_00374 [Vibrio phage V09]
MSLIGKIKEFLFPTITPPAIGDKFRQIEKNWVDVDRDSTIIVITNVSKDGRYIKYEFTQIEGKPVAVTHVGRTSSSVSYEFPTHQLYRLFEKVE